MSIGVELGPRIAALDLEGRFRRRALLGNVNTLGRMGASPAPFEAYEDNAPEFSEAVAKERENERRHL